MIEFNGNEYELRYPLGRIEIIETVTKESFMAVLTQSNMMLTIKQLRTYFSYGLRKVGGNGHLEPKKAMEIFDQVLPDIGYTNLLGMVLEAIQKDCPFFFQAD